MSLLVSQEHKFYSTSGKILEKISSLQSSFNEIEEEKQESLKALYNPLNCLKSRTSFQNIFSKENNNNNINNNYTKDFEKLEANFTLHMNNKLISYQEFFSSKSKEFTESLRNIKLKAFMSKLLEKSKSTDDVSHSGSSLNNNKQDLSKRNKFNYEAFDIDHFIIEGKSNENINDHFNTVNKINYNFADKENYYNSIKNNNLNADYKNENKNLIQSNKLKLIPIKIPSSNTSNFNYINNEGKNNQIKNKITNNNLINKNLNVFSNTTINELSTENRPFRRTNEQRKLDTGDSKPLTESSFLSSSMLSDSNVNNELTENEIQKLNSIQKTKEKKTKYSQKYLSTSYQDYLKNYLQNNILLNKDGLQPKSQKEFESSKYNTPKSFEKAAEAAASKYEPKVITKEKIANYYLDSFSLKQNNYKENKEAQGAYNKYNNSNNKIRLKFVSNSHSNNNLNVRTALVEKSFKEKSNQDYYADKSNNKNFKKSSSLDFETNNNINNDNFNGSGRFQDQHKSKFQSKDEQDAHENINFYDENKENFKNADNVNYINLPININNRISNKNNKKVDNSKENINSCNNSGDKIYFAEQEKTENLNNGHQNTNNRNTQLPQITYYSSLIKKNPDKQKSNKEIIEIQENFFVDVSESQGDVENKIHCTEQKIKLKLNNNKNKNNNDNDKHPQSPIKTLSESSEEKKQTNSAEDELKNKNLNNRAGNQNIINNNNNNDYNNNNESENNTINKKDISNNEINNLKKKTQCISEINSKFQKLIQDDFPESCSEFQRLECWEEVSLPKQLSESIKMQLFGELCKNQDKSMDVIESNVSNFSSDFDFEDKKTKNKVRKNRSNATSTNKDAEKSAEKRNACGKSQFENFYREILSKENNNALIIYDVFNEKNDFGVDFFEDNSYNSENNIANGNNNNINDFKDASVNDDGNLNSEIINEDKDLNCLKKHDSCDLKVSELVQKIKEDSIRKSFKQEKKEEN